MSITMTPIEDQLRGFILRPNAWRSAQFNTLLSVIALFVVWGYAVSLGIVPSRADQPIPQVVTINSDVRLEPRFGLGFYKEFCLLDGSKEIGLFALELEGQGARFVTANRCAADEDHTLNLRKYPLLSTFAVGPVTLYDVKLFDPRSTLRDMIYARVGDKLGSDTGSVNDLAFLAAGRISSVLLCNAGNDCEANDAHRLLSFATFQTGANSPLHWLIVFAFAYGILGTGVIYGTVLASSKRYRVWVSLVELKARAQAYSEILEILPTIGLLGTIVGLMLTLWNFLGRQSPDPTMQTLSNSASLGGIILALSTTFLASILLIVGKNFVAVPLESWLVRKYED